MKPLRRLNTGIWNKPPIITGARRLVAETLASAYPMDSLGSMADFVNGTSYDAAQLTQDGLPIVRISNITNPQSAFLRTGQEFPERFIVKPGDLLVSWSASFKTIVWPGPLGIVNQHIFRVSPRAGNDARFIRHAIEAAFDEMQRNVVGIGMMHLRRNDFVGHQVPRPSEWVQSAVADYLDWVECGMDGSPPQVPDSLLSVHGRVMRLNEVAAKVETATKLAQASIRGLDALLPATLHKLADSFVGELGRLERVLTGKPRNGWSAACDNAPSGTPVLTLSAITGFHFNSQAYKTTSLDVDPAAAYWARPGDLLMTRSNTPALVGHAAIYDGNPSPCIFPDLVMRIPTDPGLVDQQFLWYWLQTPQVRSYLRENAKGTSPTMKKISQGTVMAIPFPQEIGLARQQEIVRDLDRLNAAIRSVLTRQREVPRDLDAVIRSVV